MKAVNIKWDIDPEDCESGVLLLPDEINIPKGMTNAEDISDYISDMTGFCHKGFSIME